MKYLLSDDGVDRVTRSEDLVIDVFHDQLRGRGPWILAGGPGSPSTVIDNRGAHPVFNDGPLVVSRCCDRKVEMRPILVE